MIKQKPKETTITLDLTGPQGNAFVLLGFAGRLARRVGYTDDQLSQMLGDMKAGDYEHLIQTFDKHFGSFVILLREE